MTAACLHVETGGQPHLPPPVSVLLCWVAASPTKVSGASGPDGNRGARQESPRPSWPVGSGEASVVFFVFFPRILPPGPLSLPRLLRWLWFFRSGRSAPFRYGSPGPIRQGFSLAARGRPGRVCGIASSICLQPFSPCDDRGCSTVTLVWVGDQWQDYSPGSESLD